MKSVAGSSGLPQKIVGQFFGVGSIGETEHQTPLGYINSIAVPYAFNGAKNDTKIAESRHMAIEVLHRLGWIRKPIHFLGMGDPREFDYYNHVTIL